MRNPWVVIATIAAVSFVTHTTASADAVAKGGDAVAQSNSSETSPPVPATTPPAPLVKPATPPRARTTATRHENADCAWTGKRTVQVLVRDDLIAADGFFKFYNAFGCPVRHLSEAFSCTVDGLGDADARAVEVRIETCWNNPAGVPLPIGQSTTEDGKTTPNGGSADPKVDPGSVPPNR
jgi:hypothetical protein